MQLKKLPNQDAHFCEVGVNLMPTTRKRQRKNGSIYVMEMLRKLRVEQSRVGISRFVFTQKGSSEPMHPQSPTRYFKKLEVKYGIQNFHPHKLRHSFASIAITNGADVASISEILGHSDKAVTLRMYTHADEESRKKASNIFQTAITTSAENVTLGA